MTISNCNLKFKKLVDNVDKLDTDHAEVPVAQTVPKPQIDDLLLVMLQMWVLGSPLILMNQGNQGSR